jgi:hypothetical protein
MKKEQKSARELAELVAQRIGMTGVTVEVHPDPVYDWHPTVFTTPNRAVNAQNAAERAPKSCDLCTNLSDERREDDRPTR